jgi:hypothetical protein
MHRTATMAAIVLAVGMVTSASFGGPLPFKLDVGRSHPSKTAPVEIVSVLGPAPNPTEDLVPGHPGVTYLQLLRQAIPDLAYNPATKQVEGHLKSLRHIMGDGAGGDPPDPLVADFLEVRQIKAGGRPRLVVLADLGQAEDSAQSTTLMALYDDAPRPKLLDAVDVGVDKDTGFNEKPSQLALGAGDDALVILSGHGNSNQSYQARLVIFVRGDRLRLIDDIFVLSDNACGYQRDETPVFTTQPGAPYAALQVTVTERLKRLDEDCGDQAVPPPYVRTYHATYRWDAAKGAFVGHGDLVRLDKLNRGRF